MRVFSRLLLLLLSIMALMRLQSSANAQNLIYGDTSYVLPNEDGEVVVYLQGEEGAPYPKNVYVHFKDKSVAAEIATLNEEFFLLVEYRADVQDRNPLGVSAAVEAGNEYFMMLAEAPGDLEYFQLLTKYNSYRAIKPEEEFFLIDWP